MSALREVLSALAAVLDQETAGWFLFGAQAVAIRGAPRTTQDVDVTVQLPRKQLPQLAEALRTRGIEHRFPESAAQLIEHAAVLPMIHRSTAMEIDIVIAGSGLESLALSRAERLVVAGVSIPVAQATDLVVFKVLAGRGKDLEDAGSLLAAGEVRVPEVQSLLEQLEIALGVSDLVPRFVQLLGDESGG